MRALIVGLALLAATTVPPRVLHAQDDPPGTRRNLLVRVQTAEDVPIGFAVVAMPDLDIERFTGAGGTLVLAVPRGGAHRLVVKRLGFTPKDTTITVTEAASQVVVVRLARVVLRLREVQVSGWPACANPGLRDADEEVRRVVDQLQQNAERYRLLVRMYPFTYLMRKEYGSRGSDGSYIAESHGLGPVSAVPSWRYRPGTLVAREGGQWIMRIPSIGDLAEDAFIDNHCFHVAGVEMKEDARLLRIDIVAAERLRAVDVNAVVWLDTADYQLRHATYTLTRAPTQVKGVLGSSSTAWYRELIPFVPIIERLSADNIVQVGASRTETLVMVERQTNIKVTFDRARPDSLLPDSLPRRVPDR